LPKGVEEGILKGMYLFKKGSKNKTKVQLLGSGTILREVIAASDLLRDDFDIDSDIWSVTSFNELRKEGIDTQRHNMLHPDKKRKTSYVEQCLKPENGPVIASSDYMRIFADQISNFIPHQFVSLGTDGFGRSDTRIKLRKFFEVDRYYVAIAALTALSDEGTIDKKIVSQAIKKYQINPDKPNPVTV